MKLVYLAHPIDQVEHAHPWVNDTAAALAALDGTILFRPGRAFQLTDSRQPDPRIEQINRAALDRADVLVAVLPAGVASIGVPREIEYFSGTSRPWAVITNIRGSFSLVDAWHLFRLDFDGVKELTKWVQNATPVQKPEPAAVGTLLFTKDGSYDGQLPTRAHAGDAGYDLYVAEDITIPIGAVKDVPCGVRVALPDGITARIVGRSSTIRTRGLTIDEGTIDSGWRGPLFAAVHNIGATSTIVRKGERIAQLILTNNVSARYRATWTSAAEFATIPHDGRGESGFGSSGQ